MSTDQLNAERLLRIEERLDAGQERMDKIDSKLGELAMAQSDQREKIDEILHGTAEIREIMAAAKGFFKVAAAIGNALKWVAGVVAAVAAAWVVFNSKGPTP